MPDAEKTGGRGVHRHHGALCPEPHHHELPDRLLPRSQRRTGPGQDASGSGGAVSVGEQRIGGPRGRDQVPGGLYPLRPYTREEADDLIRQVETFAEAHRARTGTRLVWCSDEFYLLAGRELPPEEYFEEFTQLDNGVGMLTLLSREFARGWT